MPICIPACCRSSAGTPRARATSARGWWRATARSAAPPPGREASRARAARWPPWAAPARRRPSPDRRARRPAPHPPMARPRPPAPSPPSHSSIPLPPCPRSFRRPGPSGAYAADSGGPRRCARCGCSVARLRPGRRQPDGFDCVPHALRPHGPAALPPRAEAGTITAGAARAHMALASASERILAMEAASARRCFCGGGAGCAPRRPGARSCTMHASCCSRWSACAASSARTARACQATCGCSATPRR